MKIEGLWRDVTRVDDLNEVDGLLREWFRHTLDQAWRDNFRDPTRDILIEERMSGAGDEWSPERFREERRAFAHNWAMHRSSQLESGTADLRPSVDQVAMAASPSILSDDRRRNAIEAQIAAGEEVICDAVTRWAAGEEDFRPDWTPRLPEADFPKPKPKKTTRRSASPRDRRSGNVGERCQRGCKLHDLIARLTNPG